MKKREQNWDDLAMRFEKALFHGYKNHLTYKCTVCGKQNRGKVMKKHLLLTHARANNIQERLSACAKKQVKRLLRRFESQRGWSQRIAKARIKPVKRSEENKKRDSRRSPSPVLDPDCVKSPAGDRTWATRRKRVP